MASPIVRGQDFSSTELVNATKLQNIVDNSTFKGTDGNGVAFSASSGGDLGACVAAGGLEVHSTGQLQIKDNGVTAAKIAAGALTDVVYPVGAIFTTVTNYANSAAVVNAIGGTTWTAFGAGKVLVGLDSSDTDFDTAEETGGDKTVTLDITQIPSHTHNYNNYVSLGASGTGGNARLSNQSSATSATGGGAAHTNVQPYIVVYMWKRTA